MRNRKDTPCVDTPCKGGSCELLGSKYTSKLETGLVTAALLIIIAGAYIYPTTADMDKYQRSLDSLAHSQKVLSEQVRTTAESVALLATVTKELLDKTEELENASKCSL